MRKSKLLALRQLDRKTKALAKVGSIEIPAIGWIKNIRNALNMTQNQLGKKLNISRQSVSEIESRETEGSISLRTLQEVGNAFNSKLVYAFIPKDSSFESLVDKKASALARKIVLRTHKTMQLEDQAVEHQRIDESIDELTQEIKSEMKKSLWD